MTFLHKIQKRLFQNRVFLCFLMRGHFVPLEAGKHEKPYCVDPKWTRKPFLCRFLATRGQIWPLNIKCKKIIFKIKFFCVKCRGVLFGLWRPQNAKNIIPGTQKSFISRFPASRGRKWPFCIKYKKILFQIGFFCVFWWGVIFGLWRPENMKNLIAWTPNRLLIQ